ncbi:MAG TPA: hypothetical protein PK867_00880, partial [Pirellulales bacterium]|nr:hypothetical protein [Pirellulales bacterium]
MRRQFELLEPVARHGAEYQRQAQSLERRERMLAACGPYFSLKTIELFTPKREQLQAEAERTRESKERLAVEMEETRESIRCLRNDIEGAGGNRLREIKFLLDRERERVEVKRREPSIEKVLRGFALSLLVPEKHYRLIAGHVDRTRLSAEGRGQRLVYLRVAEQAALDNAAPADPRSRSHKITFRIGHSLAPWVNAEVQ